MLSASYFPFRHLNARAQSQVFGYLHDAIGSYDSSFVAFVIALALSVWRRARRARS